MIRARRPAIVLLTLLCALLVTACGGGDKPSGAEAVLKETFGPDKPVKSGAVDATVSFDATGLAGLAGPVKLALKGPFQSQGGGTLPLFDFDLGLTAGGSTITAGATSADGRGFLKLEGSSYALPASVYQQFKQGYEQSTKAASADEKQSDGPSFRTLGIDPLRWLSDAKSAGTEQVGGVEATHVTATVDVPKLLADVDTLLKKAGKLGGAAAQAAAGVPDGLSSAQRKTIEDAVTQTSFDVWAGKADGTLRKLDVSVAFDVPASAQKTAGGLKAGKVGLSLTIGDLNKPQTVSAPKTLRPFTELQAGLGQLLGAFGLGGTGSAGGAGSAGTGATGTGSGSGTTGGTGSSPQDDYDACMAAAGADIAKVNACAPLLNK